MIADRLLALQAVVAPGTSQSILDPAGPAAERIDSLWWVMLAIATVVFVIVMAALGYALLHRRTRTSGVGPAARDRRSSTWVLIAGAVVPTAILVGVFIYTMGTLAAVAPASAPPDLVVEVTGRQWWWDVRYVGDTPNEGFYTANEIRVPVGRRVEIRLRSLDVIHSFWVPQLQGKMDLIPGRERVTWIQADRPGMFRGQCAEYCGLQHSKMAMYVVAMEEPEFEQWRALQLQPAVTPASDSVRRGEVAFVDEGCAMCHMIRGTPAAGRLGPDLTHLASRYTLAAGTLPNTAGHLTGWIANPQAIKPGNLMPALPLDPGQLHAIVQYLQTLR